MSQMASASKRVCLLTGASGTLGSTFCHRFADRYDIAAVFHSRPPEVPSQHQRFVDPLDPGAQVAANQHPIFAVRADLAGAGEIDRLVDLVLARFGRIDVVVNAARHSALLPLADSDRGVASLDRQFHLNTSVPVRLATTVARKFWRSRDRENHRWNRSVVNVSSTAGLYVYPDYHQSAYAASKAALNHLTCHLANEFRAFGVRVNATAPNTFPQLVSTESVAETIVRLDRGRMNGRIVVLDTEGETLL
jgi:NAD(P)-dependent dehydrogenase (short-subunit alcohol dehydrogenase family)